MLPEDPRERLAFDRRVAELGSPLAVIQSSLHVWCMMAPEGWTYRDLLAIYANELEKMLPQVHIN